MITIYYYLGKNRSNLTARVMLGRKRVIDKGTGIKVAPGDFDMNTKRFIKDAAANKALSKFETELYQKMDNLSFMYRGTTPPIDVIAQHLSGKTSSLVQIDSVKLTLSEMGRAYAERSQAGVVFNKKSGKPLSPATIENNVYISRMVEIYLEQGGTDFDFGMYNASNIPVLGRTLVKNRYTDFISSYKNFLIKRDLADGSMYKNLYRLKRMINYFMDASGIELGDLLNDLKYRKPKKDVVVLSEEQTLFILHNYEKIRSECSRIEADSFDYWYTALILNPRRGDMGMWTKSNLFVQDGQTWIRYIPNKTKGTSGAIVETMVPDSLNKVFERNLKQYGKLMPPLRHNLNLHLKRIARRYDVFKAEIQVLKKGAYTYVRMCDHLHIHMMRSTGISHKLTSGWGESFVKESSGHAHDSESFKRYVKISNEAKQKVSQGYYKSLGL